MEKIWAMRKLTSFNHGPEAMSNEDAGTSFVQQRVVDILH